MTELAEHNSNVIRDAGKATLVLQGFAVLLLLGLVSILIDISQRYSSLQDGVRENALWSVHQLDREARRLNETLHIMLIKTSFDKADLRELSTRYDILYSRMDVLDKANFERKFLLDDTIAKQLATIQAVVFDTQKTFDAIASGKPVEIAELADIDGRLDGLVLETERLLARTNANVSTERAEVREAILSLQFKSAILVGLLVVSVCVLIVMLRRQLTSVRLAGLTLERVSAKLNVAFLDAEAGNRAKSQFMASMGHEIRTPLNAILGTAELLQLSNLPQSVAPGVQTIRRSGEALLDIINEILDFAKIEHGKFEVETRTVDIRTLADNTVAMIRDRATEHGNRVVLDVPDAISVPLIESDPTRLRQVMLNLLSNAVKFTSQGTVTLRIREQPIVSPAWLRVEVSDTGIGIDKDGLEKLFQPFSQVDSSISRKYGGTGLGLTICKQIVETLGGRIGVVSRKGEGSTFWFEVPLVAAAVPAEPAVAARIEETGGFPSLSVLVVEDNLVNQQVAAGFLAHLGQRVLIAGDGLEAVAAVADQRFDLILMDMQMPNLDGIEATRRIRALGGRHAEVPIIPMTANASDDDRRLCHEAGMTGFQSKPLTMQQLRSVLASIITAEVVPSAAPSAGDTFEARRAEIVDVLGEETFDELVASFFDDAAAILDDLHKALADNDHRQSDRLLHTLKGAASSIGLDSVADRAQALRQTTPSPSIFDDLRQAVADQKQRLAA